MARRPIERTEEAHTDFQRKMNGLKGQFPDVADTNVPRYLVEKMTGAGNTIPHFATVKVPGTSGQRDIELHIVGHPQRAGQTAGAERDILDSLLGMHATARLKVTDIYRGLSDLAANIEKTHHAWVRQMNDRPGRKLQDRVLVAKVHLTPKGKRPSESNTTILEIYASDIKRPVAARALRRFSQTPVPGTITLHLSRPSASGKSLMNVPVRFSQSGQSTRVRDVIQGGNNQRANVMDWLRGHASEIQNIIGKATQGINREQPTRVAHILRVAPAFKPKD